jgi:hypothetical protein
LRNFCLLATLLILAVSASAAPVDCTTVFGSNVLALNPDGCYLDGLVFDQFAVASAPPGGNVFLSSIGTQVSGTWVNLGFQLTQPSSLPGDIILEYRVTAMNGAVINGVDNAHNGIDVRIQEIVCSSALVAGGCPTGNVLANFANPPTPNSTLVPFADQTQVWIQKDIQFNTANAFISSFTNSHHVVPEPATFAMLGGGLVMFALYRRRRA